MVKVKFFRGYGGWTSKSVITVHDTWIPRNFCTNWPEDDKPPKLVEASLPKWLYDKVKHDSSIEKVEA